MNQVIGNTNNSVVSLEDNAQIAANMNVVDSILNGVINLFSSREELAMEAKTKIGRLILSLPG